MNAKSPKVLGGLTAAAWTALAALIFIVFQIVALSTRAPVPQLDELEHIEGFLVKTEIIRRKGTYDAEVMIRSGAIEHILYIPDASSVRSEIASLTTNIPISADYSKPDSARNGRSLLLRTWNLSAGEKQVVGYADFLEKERQERNFSLVLIAISSTVFLVAVFLAIPRRRRP